MRRGDREAYAELVRRNAPIALRTATLLGAGSDAEDVVQEAFVKAYGALSTFRRGAAFRPWLLRIVSNETRNLHRGAGRRRAREQVVWERTEPLLLGTAESSDPAGALLATERPRELVVSMAKLSEAQRQVVTCRFLLDLDERETATVLNLPRGTVKSRLSRALRTLGQELERSGDSMGDRAGAAEVSGGS